MIPYKLETDNHKFIHRSITHSCTITGPHVSVVALTHNRRSSHMVSKEWILFRVGESIRIQNRQHSGSYLYPPFVRQMVLLSVEYVILRGLEQL